MNKLISRLNDLRAGSVKKLVDSRLAEFEGFKSGEDWFSELCFCILTANSRALTGIRIQEQLGNHGFLNYEFDRVKAYLRNAGHRFYNKRAEFIIGARKFVDIKDIISKLGEFEAREWLVKNVVGIGYKEASHFLRNIGFKNVAILDRHIISIMFEYGLISSIPKHLSKKQYLEMEEKLRDISRLVSMNLAELDLYLWFLKTGKILK